MSGSIPSVAPVSEVTDHPSSECDKKAGKHEAAKVFEVVVGKLGDKREYNQAGGHTQKDPSDYSFHRARKFRESGVRPPGWDETAEDGEL